MALKKNNISAISRALFIAMLSLLVNGCLSRYTSFGVVGRPAVSADHKLMVVLVAESEATSRQVNGGYVSTTYKTSYWLKQFETATGKLLQKKKIIGSTEYQNLLPVCFGGNTDKIWLHTSGLKAYSITTLEELISEQQLAGNNGFNPRNFPDDVRFYDEAVADGYINFISTNGDRYQIDLSTLKIINITDSIQTQQKAQFNQTKLLQHYAGKHGIRSDTLNGNLYVLAADSATAARSRPGDGNDEPIHRRLHLYTGDYSVHHYSGHYFFQAGHLQQAPGNGYLNGLFLKDGKTGEPIHLKKPGCLLILHNDSIGANPRLLVTAIDKNNHPFWQTDTGLGNQLADCWITNNLCILVGNKDALISPPVGSNMLCILDLTKWNMLTLPIKD